MLLDKNTVSMKKTRYIAHSSYFKQTVGEESRSICHGEAKTEAEAFATD
jgi:hypothetical protein